MTIEETIKKMLHDHGLFENQCDEIMIRIKESPANEAMEGRWQHNAEDYPDAIVAGLWVAAKDTALKYIDETCPLAWFRPMFDPAREDTQ